MDKKTFFRYSLVFSAVYFFSLNGLASLPNLSLSFLLKEGMKLKPAQMAYFQAVTLLAWVIKPLWGFISDTFPLLGSRRKSYLILTSLCAIFAWVSLALIRDYTVSLLLLSITVCYMAYAFQDVVADGLMIEVGKPANLTGKLQSIQWGSVYTAIIITSFCGGYVSDLTRRGEISYQVIFAMTAIFPLMTFFIASFFVTEPQKVHFEQEAKVNLGQIFKKKELWILALFLFFWNFSPSFGAPFFYYSVDTLKFDGSFLGILQGMTSFAGLLGSIVFGKYIGNFPIRKLLIFATFLGVIAILFTYVYFLPFVISHTGMAKGIAVAFNMILGIVSTLIFLTLLNLTAKFCPEHAGGTVFAFLMSCYNLGQMGSELVGGVLFSIIGLKPLIAISALFSLITLLFLPYLSIPEDLTPLERGIKNRLQRLLTQFVR